MTKHLFTTTLVAIGVTLVAVLALFTLASAGMKSSHTPVTIVQTIHNVSYHGMTCTETIDSTGNSYMNGCSR